MFLMKEEKEMDAERSVKVLMVEDSSADIFLIKEHLKQFKYPLQICVARDGEEALASLRQSLCFTGKQDPDFILLDLNLPKMDGRQVLAEIKNDPGLKHIPVLILTSSTNEQDRATAHANHADSYIQKPSNLEHYPAVVRSIEEFWSRNNP
jgi:two-component system, chemotaxis family, response regulator Rcp1